jgi:hypothetical protein
MMHLKTNIEKQNKEIRSSVANCAICGNASWTVTGGNMNRYSQ